MASWIATAFSGDGGRKMSLEVTRGSGRKVERRRPEGGDRPADRNWAGSILYRNHASGISFSTTVTWLRLASVSKV